MVFTIFLFTCWWNNQTQCFSLLLWNYLLVLKILSVTLFKDSKAAIFTLKFLQETVCDSCKIILEAACDKLVLAIFPEANEGSTVDNSNQSQRRELWGGFSVSIFKINKKFQRSKYKGNNCIGQWKAFERPWKPSGHTQKVLIKMFKISKISITWPCPF